MINDNQDCDIGENEGQHDQNLLYIKAVVNEISREVCSSCNHPSPNKEKHIVVGLRHVLFLCLIPFDVVTSHEKYDDYEEDNE